MAKKKTKKQRRSPGARTKSNTSAHRASTLPAAQQARPSARETAKPAPPALSAVSAMPQVWQQMLRIFKETQLLPRKWLQKRPEENAAQNSAPIEEAASAKNARERLQQITREDRVSLQPKLAQEAR